MNQQKAARKYWQVSLTVAFLAILLVACGGTKATPSPTTVPTAIPPTVAPTDTPTPVPAVMTVIQDFETNAVPYDGNQATASLATDIFYTGTKSLKSESTTGEWHTVGVNFGAGPVDLKPYSQLCYYVYDTTTMNNGRAANTVGIKLIDASGANVERYTDNQGVGANPKTRLNEWTLMCMNLISFTGIDQAKVDKIEFTMYYAGVYYFDDITLVPAGEVLATPEPPKGGETVVVDIQTFEAENTYYSDYQANVSLSTDVFHGGKSSLMETFDTGEWHAFGGYPDPRPVDLSSYTKLCFWINDTTTNNNGAADNTVGVKLFDTAGTNEEIWTDNPLAGVNSKTVTNEWVQMCIDLSAYTSVDLTKIDKIQFSLFWAGTYYLDDIQAEKTAQAAASIVVQDFEAEDTYYADYQANVSLSTDVFHGGKSSLMETFDTGEWHAFGAYPNPRPIDMSTARGLCFWINDTTTNNNGKADNTVGVKLFDATGTNEEIWTDNPLGGVNPKTVTNEWVQMCIDLTAYTSVDQTQIDKIQFAVYWAGTYYVDDITLEGAGAARPAPTPTPEPISIEEVTDVQTFEAAGSYYTDYQADVSLATDIFHGGKSALKATSASGEWHSFGGYTDPKPIDLTAYNKLCFWIYDTTTSNAGAADNSVGVKLFDSSGANAELWTDNKDVGANPKTVTNQWVQMCLNISVYTGVDLTKIEKVQFALYWAGTYYVDDIQVVKLIPAVENIVVVQPFEAADTFYSDYQADVSLITSTVHSGSSALMATSASGEWHAFGAYPSPRPIDLTKYSKLCFWINDTTTNNAGKADNSVGVKLFDTAGANAEIWSDNTAGGTNPKTVTNEWVNMCIKTSAYTGIDLTKIDKIQFALYWAGTYYVDDIQAVKLVPAATASAVAQDFEKAGTFYSDYQADVSQATDIFHGGASSLKASSAAGEWHAFGAYPTPRPFDGSSYSKVCFWIYDTTTNNQGKADNSVGVKLFDASGANVEVWSDNAAAGANSKTITNEWVQICQNLIAYVGMDLSKIDKIQFALYWAGTYYIDDITFEP